MWELVFYRTAHGQSPVEEFLSVLPMNHQQKIAGVLDLLRQEGPRLSRPYAAHIKGPLKELRIQFGGSAYRIFHFFVQGERVVLIHAFSKKTQELPPREIATAEARMKDYKARLGRGEIVP